MALAFDAAATCVTGGLEELSATTGTVSAVSSSPSPRSGSHRYKIDGTSSRSYGTTRWASFGTDAYYGVVVPFRLSSVNPSTRTNLFTAYTLGAPLWAIWLETDGDISLYDANSAQIGSDQAGVVAADAEHVLRVFFQNADSAAIVVQIDGTEIWNATGRDLKVSAPSTPGYFQAGAQYGVINYVDCVGLWYGTSGAITDMPSDLGCWGAQPGSGATASGTPDTTGTWPTDCDDRPITEATYIEDDSSAKTFDSDTDGAGSYVGPAGAGLSGTVLGGKWMMWAKRGTGGGTTHSILYGRSDQTPASAAKTLSTAYALHSQLSTNLTTYVPPIGSNYFTVGAVLSGAQALFVADVFAALIYEPTTSGAYDLPMGYGSFGLSGQALGLDIGFPLVYGSFALTGQAVTFDVGLPVGYGSFSLAGQDATLAADYQLAVDYGSFALSGQTLGFDIGLPIGYGSFALNGQDVTFAADFALAIDYGTFALTGQSLGFGVGLPIGYGSFALTGQTVTFDVGLPVGYGSFALSGQDVTLTKTGAKTLAVDYGAFTVSGQDLGLDIGLPISYGSFTLTGEAVALSADRSLALDYGAFTLSGQDVSFSADRAVTISYASFTFTGQDVTLTKSGAYALALDAGAFVLSGQDVTLTYTPATAEAAAQPSGGYLRRARHPREQTQEEKRREREKLGILKKKPLRVSPPVPTGAKSALGRYETVTAAAEVQSLIAYLQKQAREQEAAGIREDLDRALQIELALSAAFARRAQIEEQDIVFVVAALAM